MLKKFILGWTSTITKFVVDFTSIVTTILVPLTLYKGAEYLLYNDIYLSLTCFIAVFVLVEINKSVQGR